MKKVNTNGLVQFLGALGVIGSFPSQSGEINGTMEIVKNFWVP